jgi:hypothetical protein
MASHLPPFDAMHFYIVIRLYLGLWLLLLVGFRRLLLCQIGLLSAIGLYDV